MKNPKILLGTPTFEGKEYCLDLWIKTIKEIKKTTSCDILLVDNSKGNYYKNLLEKKYKIKTLKSKQYKEKPLKTLKESREKLFDYAIKNNYDYLFSIEQDIFPPKEILKYLLKIRKQIKDNEAIIATPYIIARISYETIPYLTKDQLSNIAIERIYSKKMKRKIQKNLTMKEIKRKKKIFKIYAGGFGCTLIDTSILKKIKLKYTEKATRPDDAFFYLDCFKQKINSYVDPKLAEKIIHIPGNAKNIKHWAND